MKTLFKFGIAAAVLWLGGLAVFNYHIRHYPLDKSTKTDAIIVLTGGSNRIKEAVEMLNGGYSDVLFISGVEKGVTLNQIARTQHFSVRPDKKIIIGSASTNTLENARETTDWINQNNISSIRLVTSNYHLPRSLLEFRVKNSHLKIVANPVFSTNIADKWWQNTGTFSLTAAEYTKFLMVYVKCFFIRMFGE